MDLAGLKCRSDPSGEEAIRRVVAGSGEISENCSLDRNQITR